MIQLVKSHGPICPVTRSDLSGHTVRVVRSHGPICPETRAEWSWAEWSAGRDVRFPSDFPYLGFWSSFCCVYRIDLWSLRQTFALENYNSLLLNTLDFVV